MLTILVAAALRELLAPGVSAIRSSTHNGLPPLLFGRGYDCDRWKLRTSIIAADEDLPCLRREGAGLDERTSLMATRWKSSLATGRWWAERGGEEGARRWAELGERLNGTANDENTRTTFPYKRPANESPTSRDRPPLLPRGSATHRAWPNQAILQLGSNVAPHRGLSVDHGRKVANSMIYACRGRALSQSAQQVNHIMGIMSGR